MQNANVIDARLPRDRTCAAHARRLLDQRLADEAVSRRALEDVKLVVSELVDNAYLHGQGQISLRVARLTETVRVEVMDEGKDAASEIRAAAEESGGYGLRIVDQLALRWGIYDGSTHVWAELPLHRC